MTTAPASPCSIPECNTDGTGEPCDRHETEQAHAAGEHEFCGTDCETAFPADMLRNALTALAAPGAAGILAELERRAAVSAAAPAVEPADVGTLPAWLYRRFSHAANTRGWDELDDADQSYWAHHAAAVRRAVARGGFKEAS